MMIDRLRFALRALLLVVWGTLASSSHAAKPTPARAATPAPGAPVTAKSEPTSPGSPAVTAPTFAIAATPAWVRPYTPDTTRPATPDSNGISYLLVDAQENLGQRASFYHEAHLITSDNGVQNGAAIGVSFDPSYEKLTLHAIRILRGGQVLDRLDRSQVRLLQREREAESFLYDGAFTAQCQLEDVRVGDVIEYAYTVEGANPVLRGRYFAAFATQWSTPMRRAIVRLIRPAAQPLHFLAKNRTITPVITTQHDVTEWLWDESDIPLHHSDPNPPRGYNSFGILQFSDFADWQQVVDWALPLYRVETPNSPDLDQEINQLRALPGDAERIVAALRFVQEDIRYLGIESGVGSHQPTPPSEVLRRRFGDCKDKTLLLGTLLQQCGLNATPALVSSARHQYVADRLPSPGLFDHVILRVENGRDAWWLDATRTAQRGPLAQLYISNFGYALVLRAGTRELTACGPAPASFPKRKVVENYRIAKPGADARLDVVTDYRGLSADLVRASFQTNSKEDVQKNYLQYYARRYSHIHTSGPITYEELPGENACRVQEHYLIPGLWQLSDDKQSYHFSIHASDVDGEMGTPGTTERTDPLAIAYPVDITQEIHAEMFEPWDFKGAQREISNAFFRYQHESKGEGRNVQMIYSYRSLTNQVSAADLPTYDATLRKIQEKLGYVFTYRLPTQGGGQQKADPAALARETQFNWPIALLAGVILIAALALAIRYYFVSRLPSLRPPSLHHRDLEGIGGWLILVAIGLCVRPFVFLTGVIRLYPTIFHRGPWDRLTLIGQSAYHPYWMPALLFELIYNLLAGVLSILLVVLFFQKRAVWPRCYVILMTGMALCVLFDHVLAMQIPAAATHSGGFMKAVVPTLFGAAIWIPYALTSQRVKATFRY